MHVPALRSIAGCEVVALAASSAESAARAAAETQVARSTGDWREITDDPGITAVTIAVPTALQAQIALRAIERGKHVFLEKPLAATLPDAHAIHRAARAANIVAVVDFEFPETPAWTLARQRIAEIGAVHRVDVSWRFQTYSHRNRTQSWKLKPESGGGTLNQFMCHVFYNLEWLVGSIAALHARIVAEGNVDDVMNSVSLRFTSGAPGDISVSANDPAGKGHEVVIAGATGTLALRNPGPKYFQGFELEMSGKRVSTPPLTDDRVDVVSPIMTRFIDAIRTRAPVEPSIERALRVQTLLDASRRSHANNGWVDV